MTETLYLPYRLKALAMTLLIWLLIFFLINHLKIELQRRIDLGSPLDRKIPFVPLFAPIYFSTYPFVRQPFILLSSGQQFYWVLASIASISLVSSVIHFTHPSKVERVLHVETGGVSGWTLDLILKNLKNLQQFPQCACWSLCTDSRCEFHGWRCNGRVHHLHLGVFDCVLHSL